MTTYDILGQQVTMPVRVRDASAATVMYDVDLDAAQALAPAGFEVVEATPGRAQFAIALVDYRDNDLGAYHEVGMMLFVRPCAGGPDGSFITHLPVDGAFTCAAGNEIWGFPKSVERIEVAYRDSSSRWVLSMDRELVLDLTVPRGGADEMPAMPLTAYSLIGGRPHVTAFTQGGSGSSFRTDGAGVRLALGPHPIAKELESLGLPARPVVLTTWTERMQATFEAPQPL